MKALPIVLVLLAMTAPSAVADQEQVSVKVADAYPYLCSGALRYAQIADLEGGVIASSEGLVIMEKDLNEEIAKFPKSLRGEIEKYPIYALEQAITRKLLAQEAGDWAKKNGKETTASEKDLVQQYLSAQVPQSTVSDREVEEFYKERANMFGGASFDQVKSAIKSFLQDSKTAEAARGFADLAGRRHKILVSSSWIKKQVDSWSKNPVEQARVSGKPSFVNFGVIGCCDKMYPIVEEMRSKYGGKLNVVFIHVGKERILPELYGIGSIPVQIFFDKEGKEIFRHEGFLPKEQVVAKLRELGIE